MFLTIIPFDRSIMHHLFLVYIAALLPHGVNCFVKSDTSKCSIGGNFWKYIAGAATLYLIGRLLREIAGRRATQIVKAVLHLTCASGIRRR
ncbi:hypothetical protein GGF32_002976 [Allomyces javanicus]|nr:hypothetical protein GGF32_002976 [Allomyces javanicus]